MSEIIEVGLDLAKSVFQVHGADAAGWAVCQSAWFCCTNRLRGFIL